MAVKIIPITDHAIYSVNGKEVYKDGNSNWICNQELTSNEKTAFSNYKKTIIENPNFKKHTRAEYKG